MSHKTIKRRPVRGAGPGAGERKLLDDALAEFERDGNPGRPWREVLQAVRASRNS